MKLPFAPLLSLTLLLADADAILAQQIEWAVSTANTTQEYPFSSIDKSGNLVAGGKTSNIMQIGASAVFDSEGEPIVRAKVLNNYQLIISYTGDGHYRWSRNLDCAHSTLKGIAHTREGNTALLIHIGSSEWAMEDKKKYGTQEEIAKITSSSKYGYLPEFLGEESVISSGLCLVILDTNGNLVDLFPLFPDDYFRLDAFSFIAHPQGGFVIGGWAGPGMIGGNIQKPVGKGGADCVLRLSADGVPQWAQLVSSTSGRSEFDYDNRISAAPDGTIYQGGRFRNTIVFDSEKSITVSKETAADSLKHTSYEVYLCSYSSEGKLNWAQTSGRPAAYGAICASSSGVYLGFNLAGTNRAFGKKVDTLDQKRMVIAQFDTRGSLNWMRASSTDEAMDMKTDEQQTLYVLGTNRTGNGNLHQKGVLGKQVLQEHTRLFVAIMNEEGVFMGTRETKIQTSPRNYPLSLQIGSDERIYVAGTLTTALKMNLDCYDKAFRAGNCYGAAPFLIQFKPVTDL